MIDYDKIENLRNDLEEYCEHENDEHGEMVRSLCHLSGYVYLFDEPSVDVLVKWMEQELANYKEHCRIVKSKETYTRDYIELEWD